MNILYEKRALLIDAQPLGGAGAKIPRYLVVSDLHVGFEEKFRGAGISIGSNSSSMSAELSELISNYRITNLVINGDVKSGTDRISKSEWENIPKFFEKLPPNCDITVVPGNHDGGLDHLLPKNVEMVDVGGFMVDGNLVMHGHTTPLRKFSDCRRLIIGHLHPIYQEQGSPISGQAVWVFLKIKRKRIFQNILENEEPQSADPLLEVVIMPSFNKDLEVAGYARQAAKQERRSAPLLRELKETEDAIVVTVKGEIIGDSSILSRIL